MLVDLGLGEFIVGRHGFDQSIDTAIPIVGDQTGIDYETLARTAPTHVLLQQTANNTPGLLNKLADQRGWIVQSLPLLALDDIPRAIDQLAALFGSVDGVIANAEKLRQRMDSAWRPRPGLAHRAGRTLIVYWVAPVGVAGPGSFHHDALTKMGLEVVPATGSPYITLDLEDLNRLNPDSILLLTPDVNQANLDAAVSPWKKLKLSAIGTGQISILNDPQFLTPSTAMIDFANRVAGVVASWPIKAGGGEAPNP